MERNTLLQNGTLVRGFDYSNEHLVSCPQLYY
jgi:hypothetical protein